MKQKTFCLLALWAVLLGAATYRQAAASALRAASPEPSLRLAEQVEEVVADLEGFIPQYLLENNVPGAAIALVRDGEVIWSEGFGVANAMTREPVTADTLFEVASNSKVVTAYIALRLVDEGVLSLDESLNSYLAEPWLPPSEYRDAITLRHVLSHTAGLGHNTLDRESLFAPGKGYSYSGIGFLYLQAVLEEVTGRTLSELALEVVFEPLGMQDSSFTNPTELTSRTASGHVHALAPALLFALPFAVSLFLVTLVGLIVLRIKTGHWRPTRWMVIGALVVAYVLALLPGVILFATADTLEFFLLVAGCGLVLVGVLVVTLLASRALFQRLLPGRRGWQMVLTILLSLLVVVALGLLAGRITNLPVPRWPPAQASAGGTMRATAGDLAKFLIELADPQHLSAETAEELQRSQVRLSSEMSWGLGPGIQHSRQGDALWQWGQHLDFQSVMIVYPELGYGAVVMTNNDPLNAGVAAEIAHRALGGKIEPIHRGISLGYNYREGN
jgi:CubicO group peptidase (beta-lactamase class C family)